MEATSQKRRPRTAPVWTELYEQRKRLSHSQGVAAKAVGVTQSSLSAWEAGDYPPQRRHYPKLAEYLQTTPQKLAVKIAVIFSS